MYKAPVNSAVFVGRLNLEGDEQGDLSVHGGVEKAICAYPSEHFAYWQRELGLDIQAGGFGENFTTTGMLESEVCIGDVFRVGSALIQISQPRRPCWKLAQRWAEKSLPEHVQNSGRSGWYFRVLEEGSVAPGDSFTLQQRREAKWSVAAANTLMYARSEDWLAAAELANHPDLSASWRATFARRAQRRSVESSAARIHGG